MYIYHVNVTTREHYRSRYNDTNAGEVARLNTWLENPASPISVGEDCICICQQRSGKVLDVQIQQKQENGMHDIYRIAVCTHSRRKAVAWAAIANAGMPPEVPFSASRMISDGSVDRLLLDRVERDLAWAFVTRRKQDG